MYQDRETTENELRELLSDVLGIAQARTQEFDNSTELFGALPELDSMAVANLLTELEDRMEISIDPDEVDGDMLGTFGGLVDFVSAKLAR